MKRLLILVFAFIFCSNAKAQFTISKDTASFTNLSLPSLPLIEYYDTFYNTASTTQKFYWKKKYEYFPTDWKLVSVIDNISCYQNDTNTHQLYIGVGANNIGFIAPSIEIKATASPGCAIVVYEIKDSISGIAQDMTFVFTTYGSPAVCYTALGENVYDAVWNNIRVFPVPFENSLNIVGNVENIDLLLTDLFGNILKTPISSTNRSLSLDTRNISKGVYFLKIKDKRQDTFVIKKIIKE